MTVSLMQVALGGAIGASGRHLVNVAATRMFGHGFPYGTITVNVVGSFLMGVLVVVLAKKGGTAHAPLLITGILGGFTTFSAFSLDAVSLAERGQNTLAMLYVLGSVALSLVAVMGGLWLARALL